MAEIFGVLGEIIATPGVPFRFGVLIASAVVVGFALMNDDKRQLIRWFFSGIVFLVLNEWVRLSLVAEASVLCDTCRAPVLFTILAGIGYGAGIAIGVYIANAHMSTPKNLEKLTRDLISAMKDREITRPKKEVTNEH